MEISGEINGLGSTNIATDTKAIKRGPPFNKVSNALQVNAAANKKPHLVKASSVQSGSYLLNQGRSNLTSLTRGIKSHTIRFLPQRLSYPADFPQPHP